MEHATNNVLNTANNALLQLFAHYVWVDILLIHKVSAYLVSTTAEPAQEMPKQFA